MKLFESKHVKISVRKTTRKEMFTGLIAFIVLVLLIWWWLK
uniref:Uncharacterized protein n=1 Tax=Loigolactobacillus rennini TaxID=238013 RepID=A0A1K2I7G4_9LACO|nr:hypothetical protein LREN565_1312 [Loigolactobacillus rennini]